MTVSEYITKLDALAEKRRLEILTAPSEYGANGQTYYVSNDGDDTKDGSSADRAWKSLEKVNNYTFAKGDKLLFERGGLWRGQLRAQGGVTYSAYGEGIKPRLYASERNYAECEWHTTDTPNVYALAEPIERDAGLIVFDGGASHSIKRIVGVNGYDGSISGLSGDLDFYHGIDDRVIYLRSDRGNPAVRFGEIEIAPHKHAVTVSGDNCTIDSLTIKYTGSHGIGTSNKAGLTVSNCEFGWIGGSIQGINSTTRYGNAIEIYVACRDYTVKDCLIYQIYDAGITHQFKGDDDKTVTMENVCYSGNLIEYCTYSIEYFLDQRNAPEQIMRGIEIKDNICRFAGCGWGDQRPDFTSPAHVKGWRHSNRAENFVIHDNIFDRSHYMILHCGVSDSEWTPKFENNTLIQNRSGLFGDVGINATGQTKYAEIYESGFGNNKLYLL